MRFWLVVLMCGFAWFQPVSAQVPRTQADIGLSFAPVVKVAAPAVVNVFSRRVVEARVSPFANDPFFSQFFRDLGPTTPQVQNALGSGVLLRADGLVVSNGLVAQIVWGIHCVNPA